MAFEIRGMDVSIEASADLSANQFLLHQVNASGELALSGAAGEGYALQNDPDAQGKAGAIRIQGVTKVVLGAALSAGDAVEANAAGKAVALAAGIKVGRLLQGGGIDEVVAMLVVPN